MSQDQILRALTEQYVKAFDAGNITDVGALFDDGFSLTDPGVTDLTPKSEVLNFIGGIFENAGEDLSFIAKNIFVDGNNSIIEFDIQIGDFKGTGTDVIEWKDGKMIAMRAYLYQTNAEE